MGKINISNVHVDSLRGQSTDPLNERIGALGWNDAKGLRYHAWVRLDTLDFPANANQIIYKNPPAGVKHNDTANGYFNTRCLRPLAANNMGMLLRARAIAAEHKLVEKALEDEKRAEAEAQALRDAEWKIECAKEAGPDLLIAAKGALAALSQPATFPADIDAAKKWLTDAIAKAEGR